MRYDVIVIGGGPAGLSAALNLVRARRTVLVIDSNRPRNAPTLASHGFLTRDGVSPLELRRLGRAEIDAYPEGTTNVGRVTVVDRRELRQHESRARSRDVRADVNGPSQSSTPYPSEFSVSWIDESANAQVDTAQAVVVATGVIERLPDIADLRVYYGTQLHSCIECDAYEKQDGSIALIGESSDLADRALALAHWNPQLTVFTNGSRALDTEDHERLASRGIPVETRRIRAIAGERAQMSGLDMEDGEVISCVGGFITPTWNYALDFLGSLPLQYAESGPLVTDGTGRTNVAGIYAAGDCASPLPSQLMIAAGAGALAAETLNTDLLSEARASHTRNGDASSKR